MYWENWNISDVIVYISVVSFLSLASYLYWRFFDIPSEFLARCLTITLAVVLPSTFLAVAANNLLITVAIVVISEELARWLIVVKRPRDIKRRHVAVSIGLIFGLIETTNWLFIDKARVALAGSGLESGVLIAADAAYIFTEFFSGFLLHGGLTALLFIIQGKSQNRERLVLGVFLAVSLHLTLNLIIFHGFRSG